jgi:hypothetical protein
MPIALEASTWLYLSTAEPSMTAVSERPTLPRSNIIPRWVPSSGATYGLISIIEGGASTAQETVSLADLSLTQADTIVKQLFRFANLSENWDGSGAAKPLADSLGDARYFLRSLAPESILPRAALHADGHAVLLFQTPDVYAELEFLGGKQIGFYSRRGGQEWSDEISFDGATLPEGLSIIGFKTEQSLEPVAA